jgi:hypothetical protein
VISQTFIFVFDNINIIPVRECKYKEKMRTKD